MVVARGVRGQEPAEEEEEGGLEPQGSPGSWAKWCCFSRLKLPSAPAWLWHMTHIAVPASVNKQSPTSPTAAPCPARSSPRQHPASSVIHSDAQLDFLFIFYIVGTPLVTPVRPSREMLRAQRSPRYPPLHVVFPGMWIQWLSPIPLT